MNLLNMSTTAIVVIVALLAIAIIVAVAIAIWLFVRDRRTKRLRAQFGPEYKRVTRAEGTTARAEDTLLEREKRVKTLDIKPLTDQQRQDFADRWEHAQARFVDDPEAAVVTADALVQGVMNVRGYPVADFEQRVADVSVDHPAVVQNYRLAHEIAVRHKREDVGIEKLREAMIHYRALFADLLYDGGLQPVRTVAPDDRERTRRAA